jgi:transcriptional regulator with GAF, ATPase, and Fis domain
MRILMSWLGTADLKAASEGGELLGPVGQAVAHEKYDKLVLLASQPKAKVEQYLDWLKVGGGPDCKLVPVELPNPTDFHGIYEAAASEIDLVKKGEAAELTLHLSPGTPAMQAVWIILGRTRVSARLIQSSIERGVQEADVPFDIAAEFIPDLVEAADKKRREVSLERAPEEAGFGDIIYRSTQIERVVRDAKKAALRNLPVLIEGESGTGKELFARAIHNNSPRLGSPFIVVNCGAIPSGLVESEFFGHKKGTFTGADSDRIGAFDAADGGTLFLDEVGELPLPAQVTILRALQEGEVKRVGDKRPHKVDVRVIAATNRGLIAEVAAGRFREDLYYRLAVAILDLPSLREREGDVGLLADALLDQVNRDAANEPGYTQKRLSQSARKLVLKHSWPGNVRELLNTFRRATLFAEGTEISGDDMARAIRPVISKGSGEDAVLGGDVSQGIDLEEKFEIVARHYLTRVMEKTGGNKAKAARLVGARNPTTFSNWLKKYDVI